MKYPAIFFLVCTLLISGTLAAIKYDEKLHGEQEETKETDEIITGLQEQIVPLEDVLYLDPIIQSRRVQLITENGSPYHAENLAFGVPGKDELISATRTDPGHEIWTLELDRRISEIRVVVFPRGWETTIKDLNPSLISHTKIVVPHPWGE